MLVSMFPGAQQLARWHVCQITTGHALPIPTCAACRRLNRLLLAVAPPPQAMTTSGITPSLPILFIPIERT